MLAKKLTKISNLQSNQPTRIKARTVWSRVNSGYDGSILVHNYGRTSTPETNPENIVGGSNQDLHVKMQKQECASTVNTDIGSISTGTPQVTAKVISNPGVSVNMTCTGEDTAIQSSEVSTPTAKVISPPGGHEDGSPSRVTNTTTRSSLNYDKVETKKAALVAPQSLCETQHIGVQDKFVNSILHVGQFNGVIPNVDIEIHNKWRNQSDFNFGFVPLAEQIMPNDMLINDSEA